MSAGLVLAVLGAGALGTLLRYLTTLAASRRGASVPWAVFAVNVVGSFVAGLAASAPLEADLRLIVIAGFAGGLTTFSTLGVETVQLVMDRRTGLAVASIVANVLVGVGAAGVGWLLGTLFA